MNSNKKLLALLLGAAAFAVASCGPNTPASSEPTPTPSSDPATSSEPASSSENTHIANRIARETIPYLAINASVNLDDYITIHYTDGTTDKVYEISSTSSDLTISGHVVSTSVPGSYTVTVTAGELQNRVTLNFTTEEHLALMDFLAPLSENPANLTADWYNGDSTAAADLIFSRWTDTNYSVNCDVTNLSKSGYGFSADQMNAVIAVLSDGNAYEGSVIHNADGELDVTFNPGVVTEWNYRYTLIGANLDSTSFEETTLTLDGVERTLLVSGADNAESLHQAVSGYGWYIGEGYTSSYYGLALTGTTEDAEGKLETASLALLLQNNSTGAIEVDSTFVLKDLGTTSLAYIEAAQADASYLPAKLTGHEITTAFANLAKTNNFTMTVTMAQLSSAGAITNVDQYYDIMNYMYGANVVQLTSTYTADGLRTVWKQQTIESDDTAHTITSMSETISQVSGLAVFQDGTGVSRSSYSADSETGEYSWGARTAVTMSGEPATEVYTYLNAIGASAAAVTTAAAESTNWTSYTTGTDTSGNAYALYAGEVGDNDGETAHNALFAQILGLTGYTIGDVWTEPEEFTSGEYHALSLYSEYDAVVVYPETNVVLIDCIMYGPFGLSSVGGDAYFYLGIEISDIGTTENDWSDIPAAATPAA